MGWGGSRNTPGGLINDRSTMRKVTSGEIGAVDLGSVEGTGVSPGMKEITPERAAELSAAHDNAPDPDITPALRETTDITVDNDGQLQCPSCGANLAIKVKMTGTMHG